MRKIIIACFSALLAVIFCWLPGCNWQKGDTDADATAFLKQFYTAYILAVSKMPGDSAEKTADSLLQVSSTDRMKKQQSNPAIDWDLILGAQYCQPEWAQTLSVAKSDTEGIYTVSYIQTKSPTVKTKTIRLKVVKEKGAFKIDEVLN